MISYFDAEQKVLKKMSLNPSIPNEAFQSLVEDEFLGKKIQNEGIVYPKVSSEVEEMDLGTEPEDWDLLNDGMQNEEILDES